MCDGKEEKKKRIALDILMLAKNTLLVNLRFLDRALNALKLYPCEEHAMLTDGQFLLYNTDYILNNYKFCKELTVRNYLHVIFHCVYRHMFIGPDVERPLWDLACDIAVENVITELGLTTLTTPGESRQKEYIDKLKRSVKMLTAEKIYAYLKENGISPKRAAEIRGEFYADNHEIWYMSPDEKKSEYGIGNNPGSGKNQPDGNDEKQPGEGDEKQSETGVEEGEQSDELDSVRQQLEKEWKNISDRMQMEVESFSRQNRRGSQAGSLVQNLKEVNRERYDYTSFLKKFAVMGEEMRINDDEFDYIFYTYGLELYQNVPLIEPLEYKDVKRIKEFVIAIDTSGSTSGKLVQTFLTKTYNILKSMESFFTKINLHIIQCDAKIQQDVKITSQEEFDKYLKGLKLFGFGGTDFRPVFTYVDELIAKKEFTNLKGLIYFTDGYGTYPESMPKYQTAFVFIDDDYTDVDVPAWAIKLLLRRDEI